MLSPVDEVRQLAATSTDALVRAIQKIIRAEVETGRGSAAAEGLETLLAQTLTLADLMGRRRLLMEMDAQGAFATEPSPLVPPTRFESAIEDLVSREPRLEQTADAVSKLYREQHAFALSRSSSAEITAQVQRIIAQSAGRDRPSAQKVIAALGPWTRAYSETVYETNLGAAYTAGRMREATSPALQKVTRAFEVVGPKDSDARQGRPVDRGENHVAAVGLIAGVSDPIWQTHSPPYGYRCRHGLRIVLAPELRRLGLVRPDGTVIRRSPPNLSAFAPHPRFVESPVQRFYGLG